MFQVSVLFSEPKIPQTISSRGLLTPWDVSVLFSEPKIPQKDTLVTLFGRAYGFSALQRAENSSNDPTAGVRGVLHSFQCSSASRKFLKVLGLPRPQRTAGFQCSSASRKFLKLADAKRTPSFRPGFSALQRAENSSNFSAIYFPFQSLGFSALQRAENSSNVVPRGLRGRSHGFSALQRAENSSNQNGVGVPLDLRAFQCSSASRKFLKWSGTRTWLPGDSVSVLFSEPKIPQMLMLLLMLLMLLRFSALQRAENSSNAAG